MQSPVGMQPKNPMSFLKIVRILYRIGTFLRSTEIDNSCVGALNLVNFDSRRCLEAIGHVETFKCVVGEGTMGRFH